MNANQLLVERLAKELLQRNAHVVTAESCTGGWIAKTLTDLQGSSGWFEYGYVSYGNNAKTDMLHVPADLIAAHGAVSREVAEAMATGAIEASGADFGLSVTGIAGPDGGSPEKPVGTVWFAFASGLKNTDNGQAVKSVCHHFDGDRDTIRRISVSTALSGMLEYLAKSGL
jgi:nicotinamide-nucleotide amidase